MPMPRAALVLALLALAPAGLALPPSDPASLPIPPANGTMLLPLSLGTLTLTTARDTLCPSGFTCQGFTVACPGVSRPLNGFMARVEPTGPVRGVGVFFSGGGGGGYELVQVPSLATFVGQLRADGFRLVSARWVGEWLAAPAGEHVGFAKLACRTATLVSWVHADLYAPLGLDPPPGVCGFCIQGNSGGSTQVGFTLSHYGLDVLLDGVFPTGGPPHAALQKSCGDDPAERDYHYPDGTRRFIDTGWGIYTGDGPCLRQDKLWRLRFLEDSVAWGGSDYTHGDTRVHILVGSQDRGMSFPAGDYRDRLTQGGSKVAYTTVPNTPHFVLGTPEGQAAVRAAFLAS